MERFRGTRGTSSRTSKGKNRGGHSHSKRGREAERISIPIAGSQRERGEHLDGTYVAMLIPGGGLSLRGRFRNP